MYRPSTTHWSTVKRILQYLKGTLNYEIFLRNNAPLYLHAFADADWARHFDDRTSMSGYSVFLGATLISWSSKKQKIVA